MALALLLAHGERMNALGDLLRKRRDELRRRGDSVRKIAERAGLEESVIYLHLAKRTPYRQTPYARTLEGLAKGFQLDSDAVWEAAREATGSRDLEGNALQQLLIAARDKRKLSNAEISRQAKDLGFTLSRATLTNLMNGKHAKVDPDTVAALSKVLKIPQRQIEEASAQAAVRRVTYRLPKRLQDQMTPERWDKIVQIVETIVELDQD